MSVSAPPTPPAPALPKVVGGPSQPKGRVLLAAAGTAVAGAAIGYVAIVTAWGVTELADVADGRSLGPIAVYVAMLGAVYGLIVSAAGDVASRIWDRALVRAAIGAAVGAAAGAVSGALAYTLFDALQSADDPGAMRFYLLRGLTWAVFGLGIGIASGVAEQSVRKGVNGLLGGLVGGAIGGVVFHWVSQNVDAASEARLLSLAVIGTAIGAAIGVVEVARRQAWLRVLAGGMSGKEFILYHATTNIGSSPKCQITLVRDPSAEPFHVRIDEQAGRRVLTPYDGASVAVNGAQVRSRPLRNGDRIEVGGTTLEYQERAET